MNLCLHSETNARLSCSNDAILPLVPTAQFWSSTSSRNMCNGFAFAHPFAFPISASGRMAPWSTCPRPCLPPSPLGRSCCRSGAAVAIHSAPKHRPRLFLCSTLHHFSEASSPYLLLINKFNSLLRLVEVHFHVHGTRPHHIPCWGTWQAPASDISDRPCLVFGVQHGICAGSRHRNRA